MNNQPNQPPKSAEEILEEHRSNYIIVEPAEAIAAMNAYALQFIQEISRLSELNTLLNKYNQLLSDECSELVGMAAIHGWKSSRYKKGKELREQIAKLNNDKN